MLLLVLVQFLFFWFSDLLENVFGLNNSILLDDWVTLDLLGVLGGRLSNFKVLDELLLFFKCGLVLRCQQFVMPSDDL